MGHWALMQRFLMNQASDAEKEELKIWLNRDDKNRQKFKEVKKVWELTLCPNELSNNMKEEKQAILKKIKNSGKPSLVSE